MKEMKGVMINDEDDELILAPRFDDGNMDDDNTACAEEFIEAINWLCAELEQEEAVDIKATPGIAVKALLPEIFVPKAMLSSEFMYTDMHVIHVSHQYCRNARCICANAQHAPHEPDQSLTEHHNIPKYKSTKLPL